MRSRNFAEMKTSVNLLKAKKNVLEGPGGCINFTLLEYPAG